MLEFIIKVSDDVLALTEVAQTTGSIGGVGEYACRSDGAAIRVDTPL